MTLRTWLQSETPTSRGHANCIRAYRITRDLSRNPMAMAGAIIILLLIIAAIFAPWLNTSDPYAVDFSKRFIPPSSEHWFGTDSLGRDIWSRIVYGSRITLRVVTLVAIISAPIGLLIGIVSGFLGGWTDKILMGITDIFLSFPKLVLALAFVAAMGPGIENAVIAIAITAWPAYARIARAETLTFRNAEFISAVMIAGASKTRVILSHILPLCLSSMIIRVTLDMAGVILIAAGLGYIGLGAQPPAAEWGAMIAEGRRYIFDQWWVAIMSGFAIILVSLGFCLLGDGLRDVLDPKQGDRT